MEAGEYGLTCVTCFVARRLEVVSVAGMLWISWCGLGAAGFRAGRFSFFFVECTRPAASVRPPCLIYLFTSTVVVVVVVVVVVIVVIVVVIVVIILFAIREGLMPGLAVLLALTWHAFGEYRAYVYFFRS